MTLSAGKLVGDKNLCVSGDPGLDMISNPPGPSRRPEPKTPAFVSRPGLLVGGMTVPHRLYGPLVPPRCMVQGLLAGWGSPKS